MAATRMRFTGTGTGTFYLDLNKALSLQLRKLHRQKVMTTVYGGYFVDAPSGSNTSRVNLAVAPNTWPVKRAINRGFAQWRKMIAKTLDNTEGGTTGKYSDFKIFLDQSQTAGSSSTLNPVDANGVSLQIGTAEWNYADLVSGDPDGPGGTPPDQFNLHIVGPHAGNDPNYSRVGLLQSWINSRNTPDLEAPEDIRSTTDPLQNLFDYGDVDDNVIDVINDENDHAPYDDDHMFGVYTGVYTQGSGLQRMSSAITSASQNVAPIHGFEALCGLVQVDIVRADGEWELVLDVESNGVKF